jgi:DeoR/GlpR family transcriptional regulator of sugar metabolism
MTDNAIDEANIRKVMFSQSAKKILLCDSSKVGKTCFYNMGSISEIDDIISDADLPEQIRMLIKK